MPHLDRPFLVLFAGVWLAGSAQATTYSVGPGAGCSHSQFSTALAAAVADASPGPHLVKLSSGEQVVNNYTIVNPAQDISITGGFQQCTDSEPPAGAVTTVRANAPNTRVMHIQNDTTRPRRSVNLRRLVIRGGNLSTAEGGGLRIDGTVTVTLADGVIVEQNSAANGGGIFVSSVTTPIELNARLNLSHGVIVRDNQASAMLTQGYGGGIDCRQGCTMHAWHAEITGNFARLGGGGIAVRDASSYLLMDPSPNVNQTVLIAENSAGFPADGGGLGGGIYAEHASMRTKLFGNDTSVNFGVRLIGNSAGFGGAIAAVGPPSGAHHNIHLTGTLVLDNSARQRGGALYGRNSVHWYVDHDRVGDCPISPGVRKPCSWFAGNTSTSTTAGAGGGVAFLTAEAGSQAGTASFQRTLFEDNADSFGLSAVIEATSGFRLSIARSVFLDNRAGAISGERVLIGSSGGIIDFHYNTVLDNQVGGLFYMNGGELRPQGSIFWAPGTQLLYAFGGAGMAFTTSCLVTHTTSGLPPAAAAAAWQLAPRLDARWVPRGGSPAIDHCSNTVAPGTDLYGRESLLDIASVDNRYGHTDLGAVEHADILMYNGFGARPGN